MESLVVGYLSQHLDRYLLGFSRKDVSVKLLSGIAELRNVSLRPTALQELLGPAVTVPTSHIDTLTVTYRIARIKREPIVISVDTLRLLVVENTSPGEQQAEGEAQQEQQPGDEAQHHHAHRHKEGEDKEDEDEDDDEGQALHSAQGDDNSQSDEALSQASDRSGEGKPQAAKPGRFVRLPKPRRPTKTGGGKSASLLFGGSGRLRVPRRSRSQRSKLSRPSFFDKLTHQGQLNKYTTGEKILDGMSLQIATLRVVVHTARREGRPQPPDTVVTVHGLHLVATNERWQVVNLQECRAFSKHTSPNVFAFRRLAASITVAIRPAKESGGGGKGEGREKDQQGAVSVARLSELVERAASEGEGEGEQERAKGAVGWERSRRRAPALKLGANDNENNSGRAGHESGAGGATNGARGSEGEGHAKGHGGADLIRDNYLDEMDQRPQGGDGARLPHDIVVMDKVPFEVLWTIRKNLAMPKGADELLAITGADIAVHADEVKCRLHADHATLVVEVVDALRLFWARTKRNPTAHTITGFNVTHVVLDLLTTPLRSAALPPQQRRPESSATDGVRVSLQHLRVGAISPPNSNDTIVQVVLGVATAHAIGSGLTLCTVGRAAKGTGVHNGDGDGDGDGNMDGGEGDECGNGNRGDGRAAASKASGHTVEWEAWTLHPTHLHLAKMNWHNSGTPEAGARPPSLCAQVTLKPVHAAPQPPQVVAAHPATSAAGLPPLFPTTPLLRVEATSKVWCRDVSVDHHPCLASESVLRAVVAAVVQRAAPDVPLQNCASVEASGLRVGLHAGGASPTTAQRVDVVVDEGRLDVRQDACGVLELGGAVFGASGGGGGGRGLGGARGDGNGNGNGGGGGGGKPGLGVAAVLAGIEHRLFALAHKRRAHSGEGRPAARRRSLLNRWGDNADTALARVRDTVLRRSNEPRPRSPSVGASARNPRGSLHLHSPHHPAHHPCHPTARSLLHAHTGVVLSVGGARAAVTSQTRGRVEAVAVPHVTLQCILATDAHSGDVEMDESSVQLHADRCKLVFAKHHAEIARALVADAVAFGDRVLGGVGGGKRGARWRAVRQGQGQDWLAVRVPGRLHLAVSRCTVWRVGDGPAIPPAARHGDGHRPAAARLGWSSERARAASVGDLRSSRGPSHGRSLAARGAPVLCVDANAVEVVRHHWPANRERGGASVDDQSCVGAVLGGGWEELLVRARVQPQPSAPSAGQWVEASFGRSLPNAVSVGKRGVEPRGEGRNGWRRLGLSADLRSVLVDSDQAEAAQLLAHEAAEVLGSHASAPAPSVACSAQGPRASGPGSAVAGLECEVRELESVLRRKRDELRRLRQRVQEEEEEEEEAAAHHSVCGDVS